MSDPEGKKFDVGGGEGGLTDRQREDRIVAKALFEGAIACDDKSCTLATARLNLMKTLGIEGYSDFDLSGDRFYGVLRKEMGVSRVFEVNSGSDVASVVDTEELLREALRDAVLTALLGEGEEEDELDDEEELGFDEE